MRVKCPKCQFENREGSSFCLECGGRLELACPQCGRTLPASAKFCDGCGRSMREAKAPAPVDYSKPQTYTPKFLAEKILSTGKSLEGERKLVTVLFADVAGYTSMSEKLDPEEVHQIMDGCFKILMDEVHKYEGTVDKFTGDGMMALFGAPVAHEDHAQRGCYTALSIQKALEAYGDKVKREFKVDFKMRVGLNSGHVIVGAIGNDLRMDYTAVGDTVNLASRMQSLAEPGTVLASKETHRLGRDFFTFKPLGAVTVKGKAEALEAYELVGIGQAATRLEAAIAKGLTKFIGREKEMAALGEAFEKAKSGSGQLVGMVGEAGVGKSRLLLELRRTLATPEHTYLEGRCFHYGGSIPYLPLLDILRDYFDIKEGEREFVIRKKTADKIGGLDEKLKAILPPLHELLSLKVDDEEYAKLEPQKKRERTFEAIRDLLIRESQNKPLIIAVDDFQWTDRTSDEFLNYFVGWLANSHILLVLLYRPEYTHAWGSKSYYSQIRVGQLPLSASAELVRAILEEGDVVPELREIILNRAAGNPLFMEEFTHTLLENGSIQKNDHQYVLTRKASEVQVPDTIQGIIAARMDRLEENLKRTMQVASVIGRDFAYRILHAVTGMQEELKSYLINLQGLEFIYEKSLFPELEYMFKHTLTQEVAYNSLLVKRRKELHEKIGEAIEELYPDRLAEFYEMLAHHYSRSNNLEKAYQYLKLSGDKTSRNYANLEAFRFYKEAMGLLCRLPDNDETKTRGIEVRLSADGVMKILGYPEDSLEILQEGEQLSRELGRGKDLAVFCSSLGLYYAFKGDPVRGRSYAESALEQSLRIEDVSLAGPIAFDLLSAYAIDGDYFKATETAPKVLALMEKMGSQSQSLGGVYGFNLYSAISAYYGFSISFLGDFGKAERLCEQALNSALQIHSLFGLAFAELMFGFVHIIKGSAEDAIEHLHKALKYGEEAQIPPLLAQGWLELGCAHYLLGNLRDALNAVEEGLRIQLGEGYAMNLGLFYEILSHIHLDSGNTEEAQRCASKGLQCSRDCREKYTTAQSRIAMGRVLGKSDVSQFKDAESTILEGIGELEELKLKSEYSKGYLHLGQLYADAGQHQEAMTSLKKAQAMFQEMGMDYWLARAEKALEKLKE